MSEPQIFPFPKERQVIVDAGRLGSRRPMVYGLLELDVTRPRQILRQYKEKTGESLSFTAYIAVCLGRAVETHPAVQAYRDWLGRLVVFSDVDVAMPIETAPGRAALPFIVRQANRKTLPQVHAEIRAIQSRTPVGNQGNRLGRLAPYVPGFVRGIFYWAMRKNPVWLKNISGTVIVTAVGMFGKGGAGWGITFVPWHTLGLTVGGIAQKPGVVDGRIEIREYLCLTVGVDHDVVDGAPAARFMQSLREWVESGSLLEEI